MSGHGGKREAGPGRKLGAPTKNERLAAAAPPAGVRSCASMFGSGAASSSAAASSSEANARSQRAREPGDTPKKEAVVRPRLDPSIAPSPSLPSSVADSEQDSEVQVTGERTFAERDAAARAEAVDVERSAPAAP